MGLYKHNHLAFSITIPTMTPWNNATGRKLYFCIIDTNQKMDWNAVSDSMGAEFTAESCRSVLPAISMSLPHSLASCLPFVAHVFFISPFSLTSSRLHDAFPPNFLTHPTTFFLEHPSPILFFVPILSFSSTIMPFKWDAAAERNLLLYAISEMQAPATTIWPLVAEKLGAGVNGNACRYHCPFPRLIVQLILVLAFAFAFAFVVDLPSLVNDH